MFFFVFFFFFKFCGFAFERRRKYIIQKKLFLVQFWSRKETSIFFRFSIFLLPHEFWKSCFYIFIIYNLLLSFRYIYIYIYIYRDIYIYKALPIGGFCFNSAFWFCFFLPVLHLSVLFFLVFFSLLF